MKITKICLDVQTELNKGYIIVLDEPTDKQMSRTTKRIHVIAIAHTSYLSFDIKYI